MRMHDSLHSFVRAFAVRIANEVQCGDQPPRVFYVGGIVRDMVMKHETRDVDVEVYGVDPVRVQKILEELFEQKVGVFGASFGVYTLTFSDGVLDVAIPREESKKGRGHRAFSITGNPHLSFFDALRRRDFTMNAMLADVLTQEIIDPFGGQDDIVHGVLRVVDEKTFPEDSLRVYRAMQFVSRFALTVDASSMRLMQRMVRSQEMETLSLERITEEWKKMLRGDFPRYGLQFLEESGLLGQYPELVALQTTEQDASWHPEGSVWAHVLSCFDASSHIFARVHSQMNADNGVFDVVTYRLALLLHDIGKAEVTKKIGKKIVDDEHAQAGVRVAKTFFDRFTFGETLERDVLACIRFHEDLPALYRLAHSGEQTEVQSVNALRMLWRDVGVDRIPLFLAVCEANARGRDLPLDDRSYPVRVWAEELSEEHRIYASAAEPLLSGGDVQNIAHHLGVPVPEGKKFGMLLADIESARDRGEITTRNEAILFLEKILHTHTK